MTSAAAAAAPVAPAQAPPPPPPNFSQTQAQAQAQVHVQAQAQAQAQARTQAQAQAQAQAHSHSHTQSLSQPQHRAYNPYSAFAHQPQPPLPTKRDLKSWWKGFKLPSKHQEAHVVAEPPKGIFGVPLRDSIKYANVAISLVDENGKSYIYGYVPIVVAKCGVFLKEKATDVEGIFRLSGSEKRIKELKHIFDSPDRYGKGLVWDGYTVHDAANVLRRYLNDLPEPVVPLELYEEFRKPLKGATRQAAGDTDGPQFVENFDMDAAILRYQQLITELPPLNRQLMLYILDLLAVFAAKSDVNRMNSQNLAAIFQPGMLSHPAHAMAPEEYRLNQCVIIFLIENQDHFLIGMQGTAADERTVQEVQKGTPTINVPEPPKTYQPGVNRTASNASAGAESVSKEGMIRRNKSTSSRRSLASNGAPSPGSPALTSTPTGGLGRSNTLPSKRSPRVPPGRFAHRYDASSSPVGPLTPVHPPSVPGVTPPTPTVLPPAPAVVHEVATPPEESSVPSIATSTAPSSLLPNHSVSATRSQEKLPDAEAEAATPSKERRIPNISNIFQRAPTGENELRQPNKLKKKMPGAGGHYSAHSSTMSLPRSATASPSVEAANPMDTVPSLPGNLDAVVSGGQPAPSPSDSTPKASQVPSTPSTTVHPHNASEAQLKPRESPPTSVTSYNDMSDPDQVETQTSASLASPEVASPDRDKRRRWRLSRKKEDSISLNSPLNISQPLISPRMLGSNSQAEGSNSSVGSSGYFHHRPRASMSGDVSDAGMISSLDDRSMMSDATREGRDRDRDRDWDKSSEYRKSNIADWLKNKYREHRETAELRRTKSPPAHDGRSASIGERIRKSIDLKREMINGSENGYSDEHIPMPPPPMRESGPGHSQTSIQSAAQPVQQVQPQPLQAQQPPALYQTEVQSVEMQPVAQESPAQVQPNLQPEQPSSQHPQPQQASAHQSQPQLQQEPLPQTPEQPTEASVLTPSRHMDLDD
ncbi:rho GTPase activator [Neurospora crassa OR74A]|uniref:Rho GTPase activator n=1 Tax=Neurospora crassa (strain ATCC 24698 / 74-OR23-1A / CBS 708.71 / DSM 1257 / FGSC 987) TaxID=367110 RepID=U9W393_NEUCR|nr:rho GTPase activator [Neurospora crassa OR74A]ESA43297.1 rho GTPase activator [Neurospora crassa OR74A]|eukprot:XP_011393779.1 rho GTPase activator [Neurospora crassa OR74A]